MTSSDPPRLATWLLRHFVFGSYRDPVMGDLLEEFKTRRSRSWYWRQVLSAIGMGLAQQLRTRSDYVAVFFAFAWAVGTSIWWSYMTPWPAYESLIRVVWHHYHGLAYVIGTMLVTDAAIVWVGFGLWGAVTRVFSLRTLVTGLSVAFIISVGIGLGLYIASSYVVIPFSLFSLRCVTRFSALVSAMWVVQPIAGQPGPNLGS